MRSQYHQGVLFTGIVLLDFIKAFVKMSHKDTLTELYLHLSTSKRINRINYTLSSDAELLVREAGFKSKPWCYEWSSSRVLFRASFIPGSQMAQINEFSRDISCTSLDVVENVLFIFWGRILKLSMQFTNYIYNIKNF